MAQTVDSRDLHRIVGACMVYRKRKNGVYEYLVIKRREDLKVYPGLWTVPAGGMERSEYENMPSVVHNEWEHSPLQQSTRREIMEESNVEVGEMEYLSDFTFIRPDGIAVFGVRFAAPYLKGEPKFDPNDSTDIRWITAEEVGTLDFLGTIPDVIAILDERLQRRS